MIHVESVKFIFMLLLSLIWLKRTHVYVTVARVHIICCCVGVYMKELEADERSNYEQNLMDAMAVFPKLLTGLDINVKFDR